MTTSQTEVKTSKYIKESLSLPDKIDDKRVIDTISDINKSGKYTAQLSDNKIVVKDILKG